MTDTAFRTFANALGSMVDASLARDTARRSAGFRAAPTAYLLGELTRRAKLHADAAKMADRRRDDRVSARQGKLARRCEAAVVYLVARSAR